MLPAFAAAYAVLYPPDKTWEGKVRQRQSGGGAKGGLPQMADKLFFILVYQKSNPLQTMHGLQFEISQPQTHYWIHRLLPVLQRALAALGMAPERDASRVATSALALEGAPRYGHRRYGAPSPTSHQCRAATGAVQRQEENPYGQEHPAGQRTHHHSRLSGADCGRKKHDKKAADEGEIAYPTNATLDKDTGFQGYEPAGVLTQQPKKPKGQELSVADRFLNHLISSARVVVENVIAGVKRCRIVQDVLRLTKAGMSDLVMEIACGLHNLRVSCRHLFPTCDVLSLVSSG